MIDWHRLFGLVLIDLFWDTSFTVELEKDLSQHRQLLDAFVLHKGELEYPGQLPDGFEDLVEFNLVTYKSMREALVDYTLKELTGHYVNLRKHVAGPKGPMPEEHRFRLYGISTRYPEKLSNEVKLIQVKDGVYNVVRGTDVFRVIVLSEISNAPHNAPWRMFSARPEAVQQGVTNYKFRREDASTVLRMLFANYKIEGVPMPFTREEFFHDVAVDFSRFLTPEDRLKGVSTEERLKGVDPDDLLDVLPADELVKGLSDEHVAKLQEALSNRIKEIGQTMNGGAPPAE